jgi:hypothetical protein
MYPLRPTFGPAQNPGHWIKQDFTHVDAVLHASHFLGPHTGVNIAEMFRTMWASWNIHKARRQLLVRDGAANMSVGSDLAEVPSIHRNQLVIGDAILSQRSIQWRSQL